MPEPDRPMMPCEPVPAAPAPVVNAPAPPAPLPPRPTPTPNSPTPLPAPRPLNCRFTDGKPAPKDDSVFFAAVRGAWGTPARGGSAEALRATVETICRADAAEVRAEVVGDRQVKVTLAVRNLPDWQRGPNTYYWYYATLALFQHQGEQWVTWNRSLTATLVRNQRTTGPAAGSWDPRDKFSMVGGRVYQTAICTLCLEVYYRYLPMYAAVRVIPAGAEPPAGGPAPAPDNTTR